MGLFGNRGKDAGFYPAPPAPRRELEGRDSGSPKPATPVGERAGKAPASLDGSVPEGAGVPLSRGADSVGEAIESGDGATVLARETEIRTLLPLLDEDGLWDACRGLREAADQAEGAAEALADISNELDEGLMAAAKALNETVEWQRDMTDPDEYPRCGAVAEARSLLEALSFSKEGLSGVLGFSRAKEGLGAQAAAQAEESRRLGILADYAESIE